MTLLFAQGDLPRLDLPPGALSLLGWALAGYVAFLLGDQHLRLAGGCATRPTTSWPAGGCPCFSPGAR